MWTRPVIVALLLASCGRAVQPVSPRALPMMAEPEVIVSLQGLTVHVFDRTTGASYVYGASPGKLGADGRSVTPVGHFHTGPDPHDSWWYWARRTTPEAFNGMPFLRLTARNRRGDHVYGLHGPVKGDEAARGYVSRGCVRLAEQDIFDLFALVRAHPSTPVTIQDEPEYDATGAKVEPGATPALWPAGLDLPFGRSVGPRRD